MSTDVPMDAPPDDAGAGMGALARLAAQEIAAEDPEFAAACDGMDPSTVTPNDDGGFTVACGGAEVVVSAAQIEDHLGLDADDAPADEGEAA
jgi:hypothetical protein